LRRLVVTGDDFGFSSGVNRAIVEAHRRGILTHASLMVSGGASEEAVELARAHPTLSVGLHLVLVSGRAVLPPTRIPHLVDGRGDFRGGPWRTGVRAALLPAAGAETRQEVRAQLERFAETGLPLTHVDGHHHMHLHPVVLDTLAALAREFEIPSVRLPIEDLAPALAADPTSPIAKAWWCWVFRRMRRHGERALAGTGIAFAERVYGLLVTGRLDESYLLRLLPRITADAVEIYAHPDLALEGEPRNGPPGAGPTELAALTSARVRETIDRTGFHLGDLDEDATGESAEERLSLTGSA
jgi:chitin disaccharide deacetylase